MAQTVVLKVARSKMLKARAGERSLPAIAGFAFGIGGVDVKGGVLPPDENSTGLNSEVYRKPYSSYEYVTDDTRDLYPTTCRYTCVLGESELGGTKISEIGLYDTDGDIIAIKTFSEKGKDDDVEMSFVIDDAF